LENFLKTIITAPIVVDILNSLGSLQARRNVFNVAMADILAEITGVDVIEAAKVLKRNGGDLERSAAILLERPAKDQSRTDIASPGGKKWSFSLIQSSQSPTPSTSSSKTATKRKKKAKTNDDEKSKLTQFFLPNNNSNNHHSQSQAISSKGLKKPLATNKNKRSKDHDDIVIVDHGDEDEDAVSRVPPPSIPVDIDNGVDDVYPTLSTLSTTSANTVEILLDQDSRLTVSSLGSDVGIGAATIMNPSMLRQSMDEFVPVPSDKETEKYSFLASCMDLVSSTRSRLEKMNILVNFFRQLMAASNKDVILAACFLCMNKLTNSYEAFTLNVGGSAISNALRDGFSVKPQIISALYKTYGDMGDVAHALKSKQTLLVNPTPLEIDTVYKTLLEIGRMEGHNVQDRRCKKIVKMLRACRGSEAKWLIRTLSQNIRTGCTATTILCAVAQGALYHNLSSDSPLPVQEDRNAASDAVKAAFSLCPNVNKIIYTLVNGSDLATHCGLEVCTPVLPMLAKPVTTIEDGVRKVNTLHNVHDMDESNIKIKRDFLAEYKYDGQRAQIHVKYLSSSQCRDPVWKIFSRNSEDMTEKYPDVIENLTKAFQSDANECNSFSNNSSSDIHTDSFILDCEIVPVAYDVMWGRYRTLPFQELSKRKKKDVTADTVEVSVCVYIFDILYINGTSLLGHPLDERRYQLKEILINPKVGEVVVAESRIISAVVKTSKESAVSVDSNTSIDDIPCLSYLSLESAIEEVQEFLQQSIECGAEGLILKALSIPPQLLHTMSANELNDESLTKYVPSRGSERSNAWLKLKKDYLAGSGDSFDLVVVGSWNGQGRKVAWYSPYLLACYDPATDKLQSVCRVMSGFSDEFYRQSKAHYEPLAIPVRSEGVDPASIGLVTGDNPRYLFPRDQGVQIWEIKCGDISVSPKHKGGVGLLDDSQKGLALRFPRFVRVREDKRVEDASTSTQILEAFRSQAQRGGLGNGAVVGDSSHGKQKGDDEEVNDEDESDWEL
jgi:DNA ligase 1